MSKPGATKWRIPKLKEYQHDDESDEASAGDTFPGSPSCAEDSPGKNEVNVVAESEEEEEEEEEEPSDDADASVVEAVDEGVGSIPQSPDTITDPLDIKDEFFITHGKFVYGVNSDDILLKGVPMDLPNGLTLGHVRVSRSYDSWGPHVRPNNLFVVEHEGISYLYVVMRVPDSEKRKYDVDTCRLRHVPSAVATKIVYELKKKADNWSDEKVSKYMPVLKYEETESQQIEPKAAKWQPYKKVKNVPSAEESHAPVPRKKKDGKKRGHVGEEIKTLDEEGDGEAPNYGLRGAKLVKRFRVQPGEKVQFIQVGRYAYVVFHDE